jgi:hypothetical protein
MAVINLLTGSLSGKIGNAVAIKKGNKTVFQSLPMGKTRYPPASKMMLAQFENFVRFSASMEKSFPDLFSRYSRTMTRKNYACRIFRACYQNKTFSPENAIDVIHSKNELEIIGAQFSWASQIVSATIAQTAAYSPWPREELCAIAIGENGSRIANIREPYLSNYISVQAGSTISLSGLFMVFLYRPLKSGGYTTAFASKYLEVVP